MEIVVSVRSTWGKQLFYPESSDAHFLASFTGRPTLLKQQLKLAKDRGWKVTILQPHFDLDACLTEKKG